MRGKTMNMLISGCPYRVINRGNINIDDAILAMESEAPGRGSGSESIHLLR